MIKVIVVILNLVLLFAILWPMWKRQDVLRQFYWPALLFKVCCGILLGLLYTYYYSTGDTFSFFQDGSLLSGLARNDFGEYIRFLWSGDESFAMWSQLNYPQPRSVFFAKIISVINLLTLDNYWVALLYFSVISFFGALFLSRRIVAYFPDAVYPTVVAFLFFPSVVFWSSGIIKEAVALAGIYFLSGIFLSAWHRQKLSLSEWVLLLLSAWWVWKLKYFYLAIFFPIALATLVIKIFVIDFFLVRKLGLQLLIWFLLFGTGVLLISFLHPNFRFDYLPEVIVMNNQEYTDNSSPDNLVHFKDLEPNFYSIAKHAPKALFSGIFRPGFWEADTTLKWLAGLENLGLSILIVLSIARWRKITCGQYRLLTFAVLLYIGLLGVFLTLATPNLGTLVRHRIGFMPFLVFVLLNSSDGVKTLERLFLRLVRHN